MAEASSRVGLGSAIPSRRVERFDVSVADYIERLGFELEWRGDPLASVKRHRMSLMMSEGDEGHPGTWPWVAAGDVDQVMD